MKTNQYAIYRLDENGEGKPLRHLSYFQMQKHNIRPTIGLYKEIYTESLHGTETTNEVFRKARKNAAEVSDVLVINLNGELSCFYVDEDHPYRLWDFMMKTDPGTAVTFTTRDYQVEGYKGSWEVTDAMMLYDRTFFLLEHQEYHKDVQGLILDSYGKKIMETKDGFSESAKSRLREIAEEPKTRLVDWMPQGKHLKNYAVVFKKRTEKPAGGMGTDGTKPRKRESVIRRLHEKQIAIAKRSGRPVPKYLEQQLERRMG